MYADAIFFESAELETKFRRWLAGDIAQEEQGGFFLCGLGYDTTREPRLKRLLRDLRLRQVLVVRDFTPVLNLSQNPRTSFTFKDWTRFGRLARSLNSAKVGRWAGWPIWFHTHPGASSDPSPNDWSCAWDFARPPIDVDMFAVVACRPFSMQVYKPANYPCEGRLVEWDRLPFLSYREKVFRTACKDAGLYGPGVDIP